LHSTINNNIIISNIITHVICVICFTCIKAHIRLEIEIEIGLEFNQSEERKPISSLVKFALIDQTNLNF